MSDDSGSREQVGAWVGVAATVLAVALAVAAQITRDVNDWPFPSWGEQLVECVWMVGLLAVAVLGHRLTAHRSPTAADVGLDLIPHRRSVRRVAITRGLGALAALVVVVGGAVALSDSATPAGEVRMTTARWVFTCLVRWPVSTVAQQVLFFGWLQPRLRTRHPGLVAALLYAASHVATPAVLPFVIPVGLLFSHQRRRTGHVRAGIASHYAINVALFAMGSWSPFR